MVQLLMFSTAEADGVFMHLKSIGVKVDLDDSCLAKGIDSIESLVKQYKEWCQPLVITMIAYAVLKELFKSKEIDEEIIKKVVESYSNDNAEEYVDEFRKVFAEVLAEAYPEDEEEDEEDEEDDEEEYHEEEDHDFEVSETREDCVNEEEDDLKKAETREKDMKELLKQCSKLGCSLKEGQEQQILHLIISFLSSTFSRFGKDREKCMELLMEEVQDHIARSCILDNLETLDRALETVNFEEDDEDMKKEQTVSSELKKNIVPTKDEGIATSMNELKQAENGECGDMELEECEIVTPLNLPEQEENMGNVNFCLRQPEYEDMEAKECGIATIGGAKRKLDELYHTRPALA